MPYNGVIMLYLKYIVHVKHVLQCTKLYAKVFFGHSIRHINFKDPVQRCLLRP